MQSTLRGRIFAGVRDYIPAIARDPLELFLAKNSVLRSTGWRRSRKELAAVDADGQPIPWITYPALRFLAPRIQERFRIFEFGCGSSTLWWSARVKDVTSVEHDARWHKLVSQRVPANVTLLLASGDEYVRAAMEDSWNIIVDDGIRRPDCARNSINSLAPDGVFIWDNTDEIEDREGYDLMDQSGFRRIDFWGFGPLMVREFCTTIFYRPGNCLGI